MPGLILMAHLRLIDPQVGYIMLSKPNKPPNKPAAPRPTCLQHPINKVMSGIHSSQIMHIAFDQLRTMPLFAYLPNRGTRDYLLLVSDHCRIVKALCQQHHRDEGLWGGIQVSLDLEKAFDAISRALVVRALNLFDLNPDLRHLVHSWLMKHEYWVPPKDLVSRFIASGDIKQGSKDAPMLWTLSIYLILHDLLARYDMNWIKFHMIIYADDIHLRWIVNSVIDGFEALHDLQYIFCTLKAYHFQMNEIKSVIIMRLVGKNAQTFLKRWTSRPKEVPLLHLPDIAFCLPIVARLTILELR